MNSKSILLDCPQTIQIFCLIEFIAMILDHFDEFLYVKTIFTDLYLYKKQS